MSIQDKCFAYSLVPPIIPEYETLEIQVILNITFIDTQKTKKK